MRSNIKLLIAAAVVLVLTAGVIIALTLTGNEGGDEPEETTAATEPLSRLLYEKSPEAVENVHIENSSGEYDIKKYGEGVWAVTDFVGINHSKAGIDDVTEQAASVTSQQVAAEEAEDLSVYGLAEPAAKVTVTFSDGSERKMHIGAESPSPGLTYMCFEGEKKVYAVNTSDIDIFLKDKFYFVAKTVYTARSPKDENDTTDYTKIDKITVSRKDIDYDIVIEYDVRQDSEELITGNSSSHVMTSPVRLDLNPDLSADVLSKIFGLTASQAAVVAPSEGIFANFGLDDPFAVISFEIAGETFTLKVGDEFKGENGETGYFAYADGIDVIYIFDKADLPWVDIMPLDITMTMITSTYIYAIDTVDVETGGKKVHFDLSGDADDFAVSGSEGDFTADNFKSFYQFFLRAPAEEIYLEDNTQPADVTVTVTSGDYTDTVEFIKSDSRMSVIRLNGKTSFRCRSAYTDRFIENLELLLSGQPLIETW
ncbi:MAG: DUF4340 domain-containing protein [Ruminococcus sp.]|nr:DUF4340 domain-containing protein [Ruminococcus sp.]